jgi:shikimate kinase
MNSSKNSPFRGGGSKIFLIGFMGSGKTHWGRLWAQENALEFFDLDTMIEQQEQKTVEVIFDKNGEDYFRKKESALLKTFLKNDNGIIACGGGTPCFYDNMQWMNENGTTVYLKATPGQLLERVEDEKDKRPLLKKLNAAEIFFFIEQKLKEREPFYYHAKIILPVNELNTDSLKIIINY